MAHRGTRRLKGSFEPPGDKAIAHRAAILSAMARGTSTLDGFAPGDDCARTLDCLRALGVLVEQEGTRVRIEGRGLFAVDAPRERLEAGNSGSTLRMMTGLLAPQRFDSEIGGDESLGRRPMARVIEPLERMGARIESVGQRAPLRIRGGAALAGIDYRLPVASAQVKTAVLLSGLHAEGVTRVREPVPSRDHTERLLEAFGAISSRDREGQQVEGGGSLEPVSFRLPGDVSSAAFFIGAAAALPGSHLVVEGVGLNPTRTGCLDVLRAMGAPIEERVETVAAGEPVGTVTVIGAELQGTEVPRDWVPRLIDEIPILAVAAATAQGETRFHGVGELRHKESDRLARIIQGLNALGAEAEQQGDGLVIRGGAAFRPARLVSDGDHRMAMAWGMASLASGEPCQVTDRDWVRVSYPDFWQELDRLAA